MFYFQHVNDLSGNIDVAEMISKAEGIYHQIIAAEHLTDAIRLIIGLPILGKPRSSGSHEVSPELSNDIQELRSSNSDSVESGADEVCFERAISTSYL